MADQAPNAFSCGTLGALVSIAVMKALRIDPDLLPFTRKPSQRMGQSNIGLMFAVMLAGFAAGGTQYALGRVPGAIAVAAPLGLVAAVFTWRAFRADRRR